MAFAPDGRRDWKCLSHNRFRGKLARRDNRGNVIDPDAPYH
jgi:hypothetical protein